MDDMIKISVPPNKLVYRGIKGVFSDEHMKKQKVIWVSTDPEYAKAYADGNHNIHRFYVKAHNSFDFGFRTLEVHVKLEDMIGRIQNSLMKAYDKGTMPKHQAMDLHDYAQDLEDAHPSSTMKRAWEWWTAVPELVFLLERAGYDSIRNMEGRNNDVETYGVFNHKQLRRVSRT